MTERSRLGDLCQNHHPATAPVVYPHTVVAEGIGLCGDYRCPKCGAEWKCWWDARAAGWMPWDAGHAGVRDITPPGEAVRRVVASLKPAAKPYLVYDDTTCPVCGNREGNRDHGPYEPHPFDGELGGPPDPCVHLMTCGNCRKCFDVAPESYIRAQGLARFAGLDEPA